MANPYEIFGTDKNLESGNGVTIQYPGFSVTIHRAGGANKRFASVLRQKMKPHQHKFERGLLDDETSEKILIETYAESVVIGWKGVTDSEGEEIPFTTANVVKLLTELPELFADIKAQATNAANFREQVEQAEEKN